MKKSKVVMVIAMGLSSMVSNVAILGGLFSVINLGYLFAEGTNEVICLLEYALGGNPQLDDAAAVHPVFQPLENRSSSCD